MQTHPEPHYHSSPSVPSLAVVRSSSRVVAAMAVIMVYA